MNLEDLIEEVYERGPQMYGAYSAAPRKDFAPVSTKDGYNYPYQRNQPFDNLTTPPPAAPISYPWPLQTIVDDLSDSFLCLLNATTKMSECVKNNPALTDEQKKNIFELFKSSKSALEIIKNVGLEIGNISNMADQQPSQNPVPQPEVKPTEPSFDTGNLIKIKLP